MLPFLTSGLGPELRELIHNPMSRGLHDSEFVFLNRSGPPPDWLACHHAPDFLQRRKAAADAAFTSEGDE